MLARVGMDGQKITEASFEFVRHNDKNETVICDISKEQEGLQALRKRSSAFKTQLECFRQRGGIPRRGLKPVRSRRARPWDGADCAPDTPWPDVF